MTNTKFRKRALLSSVAMLLVALVALGSATFAWFTQTPTANATGLTMTTTTSASLLAETKSDNDLTSGKGGFAHTTYLNAASGSASKTDAITMDPAAYSATNGWLKLVADSETASGSTKTVESTNVYSDRVYFKLSTEGDAAPVYLKGVTWDPHSTATMASAVYVVMTKSDGTFIGEWGVSATAHGVPSEAVGTAHNAANNISRTPTAKGNIATGIEVATAKYAESTSVGATNADGYDYVNIYVYLDGENSSVYSNNAKGVNLETLASNFNFNFSLNQ